ncbi:hypothetical protein G7Y89_g14915 [Cudoniella acicularis]|uniref:Phytochrome chromophore attachment site domain-containing protein n=1 Tax=Cudoniella acicularis TaxID=354080 RepID=A0A8H4VQI6_9HELO|nr:hypothetical protein G7Y89_g14915 [Cudoniella acicularis]
MYHEDLQQRKPVVFLEPAEFSVERVFPIRNLVADTISAPQGPIVDGQQGHEPPVGAGPHGEEGEGKGQTSSSADQSIRPHPKAGEPSRPEVIHEATHASPLYPSIPLDETIRRLPSLYSGVDYPKSQGNEKGRLISQRAQLVPSESGPPGVMPGKIDNVQPTFFRCEDEPIHTPGAVQQFGALVALRKDGEGHLEVRICSENTQHIFGYSPEGLFGLKSLLDILDQEFQEELVSRVAYALENDSTPNENTHLDVFPVVILPPDGSRIHLWCVVHLAENSKDLVICEFEDYSDVFYLKNPDAAMFLPAIPTASVDIEVSPEEMKKSITSGSKPLRALQLAKQRKQTEFSSMDIFNAMTQAQEQLATSNSVQQVFDVVVGLISELTGFHRVMFYRFDEQLNGCVEAELLNPQASSDLFRGKSDYL